MNEFWKVLELEPTSDTTAIRHAYAQKTRNCHPEENPEGFLELRKAYQAAMDYAQQGRESGSVSSREQRDSGENPVQEKGTGDTGKFQQGKEPDEKAACFLMKKEKKRKRNTSNVKNEPEEMSLKSSRKNSLTGKLSISDWIENLLKKLFKLKRWFFRKVKILFVTGRPFKALLIFTPGNSVIIQSSGWSISLRPHFLTQAGTGILLLCCGER